MDNKKNPKRGIRYFFLAAYKVYSGIFGIIFRYRKQAMKKEREAKLKFLPIFLLGLLIMLLVNLLFASYISSLIRPLAGFGR